MRRGSLVRLRLRLLVELPKEPHQTHPYWVIPSPLGVVGVGTILHSHTCHSLGVHLHIIL
jgi:hypothetical protein